MITQRIIDIELSDLVRNVGEMKAAGNRLAQICCTRLSDRLELQYSFDKDLALTSFRVTLADAGIPVPSVSGIYLSAFLYENEIHDLFGINVEGIAVDYKGAFYKTAVKAPFNRLEPTEPTA